MDSICHLFLPTPLCLFIRPWFVSAALGNLSEEQQQARS